MIEYVIGGVLHGADTKDQIKVGGNIPYFDSLEFLTRWTLKANKRAKEKIAPNQHQTMNEMVVDEYKMIFLIKTASIAVRTIAHIRY